MTSAALHLASTPARIGRRAARFACSAVDVTAVLCGALAAAVVPKNWIRTVRLRLIEHVYRSAIEPLGITLFVALITGLVLSFEVVSITASIGQSEEIGRYLVLLHVREIGPVLVNLILIGCVGSSIAGEMGLLRSHRTRAIGGDGDPVAMQVMPRVLGVAIGALCLKILFDIVGLTAGYALTRRMGLTQLPSSLYVRGLFGALSLTEFAMILVKTILPAMAMVAVACVVGREDVARRNDLPRNALPAVYGGSVFALFAITVAATAAIA